ncbi:unnamed protein product [Cunninghamella blakesleeana]
MAAPTESQTQAQDPTKKTSTPLGALEEDDEFEEFAAEDWANGDEDKDDTHYWEDNWDDDDIEDDFSQQLKAELEKASAQPQPMKCKNSIAHIYIYIYIFISLFTYLFFCNPYYFLFFFFKYILFSNI